MAVGRAPDKKRLPGVRITIRSNASARESRVDNEDMLTDSQVVGLDISPHMIPEEMPNNLDLQVDDLNGE